MAAWFTDCDLVTLLVTLDDDCDCNAFTLAVGLIVTILSFVML